MGARGSLRVVSHLLTPEERATWPKVFKAACGWPGDVMTWRDAIAWLGQLRLSVPSLSSSRKLPDGLLPDGLSLRMGMGGGMGGTPGLANSPAATRLLAALRRGHIYPSLLDLCVAARHETIVDGRLIAAPAGTAPDSAKAATGIAAATEAENGSMADRRLRGGGDDSHALRVVNRMLTSPAASATPGRTPARRPPTAPTPASPKWQARPRDAHPTLCVPLCRLHAAADGPGKLVLLAAGRRTVECGRAVLPGRARRLARSVT